MIERLIEKANVQISSLKTELGHVKKPDATVNARTSTINALHVVVPLLDDTDLPPFAKACKYCLSYFKLDSHAAEGSNTGSEGPM